jgi:hypothetical protein
VHRAANQPTRWKKDNKEEGDHATDASELKGPSKASSLGAYITVTEKVIC